MYHRSIRRHHRARLLVKRRREQTRYASGPNQSWVERAAVRLVNTATRCSCTVCASPRKLVGNGRGGLTRQELWARLREHDED